MSEFEYNDISIHYEERGEGFPLILFAPGGMRSSIPYWENSPWDPFAGLSDSFRVVAMDQRNAGQSRAPVAGDHGWVHYTMDHIALLDHLEIDRCAVLGGCIGSSYSLGLMQAQPARVCAAVLQNPIGLSGNRKAFFDMFDDWAKSIRDEHPDVSVADWNNFRETMYGTDFVFNVPRQFVQVCEIPTLILAGDDLYHPADISREIEGLAPNSELFVDWKADPAATLERVRAFLLANV